MYIYICICIYTHRHIHIHSQPALASSCLHAFIFIIAAFVSSMRALTFRTGLLGITWASGYCGRFVGFRTAGLPLRAARAPATRAIRRPGMVHHDLVTAQHRSVVYADCVYIYMYVYMFTNVSACAQKGVCRHMCIYIYIYITYTNTHTHVRVSASKPYASALYEHIMYEYFCMLFVLSRTYEEQVIVLTGHESDEETG